MSEVTTPGSLAQAITAKAGRRQWRYAKDRLARWGVGTGGLAVLFALLLIFVYLLVEVLPLFQGARIETRASFALPGAPGETLYLAAEEQGEIGMRVTPDGGVSFFELASGALRETLRLPIGDTPLSDVIEIGGPEGEYLGAVLGDGRVLPFRHRYAVTYPEDQRHIAPELEFPHGETPLPFMPPAPRAIAVRDSGDRLLLAGADAEGRLHLKAVETRTSFLGETETEVVLDEVLVPEVAPQQILLDPTLSWLYLIDGPGGRLGLYELTAGGPQLVSVLERGQAIRTARIMAGGLSLLTADASGAVTQWFPARNDDGSWYLAQVRRFEGVSEGELTALAVEPRRRVFAVGDENGEVALYHTTAKRELLRESLVQGPVHRLAFEPRAETLLVLDRQGILRVHRIHNEHPEVSFSSLWGRVWYESYDDPEFLWQSSSAAADFEPKFSLTPLTVGTLKAAFYAMLFAVPLAILAAIYTAYFMAPRLRQMVKPSVEVMQALPSVILGFLAGLWLAPVVEANLAGVFLSLLLVPLSVPLAGYLWLLTPAALRRTVRPGWEAALAIPFLVLVGWGSFALAEPIEAVFFGGNLQAWMDQELGIGYDQRNSLVVGIAMGVAVIPAIFSIAEDAIFSVPKHLSLGSLALGATPWQTLVGVVLPTASPGIFSAVMIGLGRAVGETMIVLMATGNTPVMDFGPFSGMRTLSANIAVEMPESEVGSTHFRLLFLAGLVLFVITFLLNTVAEVVRQRLRQKYSNL